MSKRSRSASRQETPPRTPAAAAAPGPSASAAGSGTARPAGFSTLLWLFFASGFAGLIYESLWTHYLKLFVGHAAYAQSLVLALFMGGLALGSWLSSRWSPGWKDLLRAYALTEAAIGLCALVFHEVFRGATALAFDQLLPAVAGSGAAVAAIKWGLASLLIFPQCVLLGMTFPLMTAGVLRAFPERPGRSLSLLYFSNSLGAVVGVLASGFWLVEAAGLPGTMRLAGLVNLGVAAVVWTRFRGLCPPRQGAERTQLTLARPLLLLLAVSAVTGATSFIYEVVWIRMLSMVLGSSTHAFELMLSAFILGLALGGLFIQRWIDRAAAVLRTLAIVQVVMGLCALATLFLYGSTFEVMRWLVANLEHTEAGYRWFNLASNGIALVVMLPATFCAGMTLPLITFRLLQTGHGERSIGAVYAANTLGAIAAVFFATHVGMPLLGVKGLLSLGAGLDLALGVAIALGAAGAFASRRIPLALLAGSAAAVAATLAFAQLDPGKVASGVFRTGRFLVPQAETVLSHRDGKTATVSVIRDGLGNVRLATNGKIDASIPLDTAVTPSVDEYTTLMLGLVPMALQPQARTVACIGMGSGMTSQTLLTNPGLERVDTIEIEEEMVRGARSFLPRNQLVFSDPRSHIHIEDAKTFFSTQERGWDLIVSEPSNPWVGGVSSLFSREFYAHVRRHLNRNGLLVQWVQLYEIDPALLASILKALGESFSDWAIYAPNDVDAIIVARDGAAVPAPDPRFTGLEWAQPSLARLRLRNQGDFDARYSGSRRFWEPLLDSFVVETNSDYHPVVDLRAARDRFMGVDAYQFLSFPHVPLPSLELLEGSPPPVGKTEVALNLYYEPGRMAFRATLLRDMVMGGLQGQHGLAAEEAATAAPYTSWRAHCETEPFPLNSFLALAERTVPWLSPQELSALWQPAVEQPCAAQVPAGARDWVAFTQAVSTRDPAQIDASASALLAHPALPTQSRRYITAAAILSALHAGNRALASKTWSLHGSGLAVGEDLLLRSLLARTQAAAPLP
jgi:spermidine synthase